jgi:hypothetical protein
MLLAMSQMPAKTLIPPTHIPAVLVDKDIPMLYGPARKYALLQDKVELLLLR